MLLKKKQIVSTGTCQKNKKKQRENIVKVVAKGWKQANFCIV